MADEINAEKAKNEGAQILEMGQKPTRGSIVLYRVSDSEKDPDILHNGTKTGDQLPAVVVNDFNGGAAVNLLVLCDGPQDVWRTSVAQGDGQGQWSWPGRK